MTGLKGMMDRSHREKQFKALSKVILGDFKQQMFMHQDKIRAVQYLINSEEPSPKVSRLYSKFRLCQNKRFFTRLCLRFLKVLLDSRAWLRI